jgi:hypothetical protein
LSDSQLALVRRATALLAPKPASKFLQLIAHQLADINAPTWRRECVRGSCYAAGAAVAAWVASVAAASVALVAAWSNPFRAA